MMLVRAPCLSSAFFTSARISSFLAKRDTLLPLLARAAALISGNITA